MKDVTEEFDYIVFDCPPSLGILTLNGLTTSDEVFLPLQPHFLALHGLSKLLRTIELVARRLNPTLRLSSVVYCMFDTGTRLANEVVNDVEIFFEAQRNTHSIWSEAYSFDTKIRRNIRLAEAPSYGQSIFQYSGDSHGAQDYRSLAEEVMRQTIAYEQSKQTEIDPIAANNARLNSSQPSHSDDAEIETGDVGHVHARPVSRPSHPYYSNHFSRSR
jgi:chromosome partitioning protein